VFPLGISVACCPVEIFPGSAITIGVKVREHEMLARVAAVEDESDRE
jgi:hypothetical protein